MNGIAADIVNQCVNETSQVLKITQAENLELAKKLLSMNIEMKVGRESGKGELLDLVA